ncbi:hypothetical protein PoB_006299200 [Plakobranchus ocellatus]|uniref:Uncharacterized protein n=1 Tax=Plakobranchus ocellatus TaxID=259542 RepID=A0AAV4CX35_9GAST|nr:hypothetical protein PoB_006299200 [Plakobranchus ocellatus]
MFCANFRKVPQTSELSQVNVDDDLCWLPLEKVYPRILASDTLKQLKPHEQESFLTRCRDWHREAVKQILQRVDLTRPLYHALKDVNQRRIFVGQAKSTVN